MLDEPFTKQLEASSESCGSTSKAGRHGITYRIAPGRRIILLTVFAKTQRRERHEVERAKRAYERCVAEEHTAEEG